MHTSGSKISLFIDGLGFIYIFQDCHFLTQAEVALFITWPLVFACFDDALIHFWFIDLIVGRIVPFIGPNIAGKCSSILLALTAKRLAV